MIRSNYVTLLNVYYYTVLVYTIKIINDLYGSYIGSIFQFEKCVSSKMLKGKKISGTNISEEFVLDDICDLKYVFYYIYRCRKEIFHVKKYSFGQ